MSYSFTKYSLSKYITTQNHIHGGPSELYGGQRTPALERALEASGRLATSHPRVTDLLARVNMTDVPRRVQAKVMSVVYATEYDEFCSRLSHRDATAVAQGAANPYAVTIVPNGDPSLDLSNAQLSTTLARRLCIPQLTHPSLSDAAEQTNVCPTCQQRHANGHLDQALVCYSCGNSGRTRWYNNVQHEVGSSTVWATTAALPCVSIWCEMGVF